MTVEIQEQPAMTEDEQVIKDVKLADLDYFPISLLTSDEARARHRENSQQFLEAHGGKVPVAVVVQRSQVVQPGQLDQDLSALEIADHLVIVLGSANADINHPDPNDPNYLRAVQQDIDNPFAAEDRQFLLEYFFRKIGKELGEELLSRISFVHSNDVFDNERWFNDMSAQVKEKAGRMDVGVSNDDGWVGKILDQHGVERVAFPFLEKSPGVEWRSTAERNRLRRPQDGKPPVLNLRGPHRIIRPQV